MRYRQFFTASTIEEAWQLNQKRANHILAGGMWLRLRPGAFGMAIDISRLGLDEIEETADEFIIGSMTSLHAIERHPALNARWGAAISGALLPIVGVQFRNCATIGGSIYGRFGFSDVLTLFMALDADVILYKGGRMPLSEFASAGCGRDILTHIVVKKTDIEVAYLSQRNAKTDFPVLTCAVSAIGARRFAVIGARPMRAVRVDWPGGMSDADFIAYATQSVAFGGNMRASAEYRKKIAPVLLRRCCEALRRED